ncbi:hypothetical protein WMY93_011512 [Mugilogobius chulae]|uniref:Endonuclease/exonuclease/phosphatase domain-containing protein n=1 Tax=Mugilogobius chulae TaxID=88201 RepID=A0AAW0PE04_9GOBI
MEAHHHKQHDKRHVEVSGEKKKDEVTLKACYQYEDNQVGDADAFAREPFVLRFSCPATVIKDLVLIPVHTKPEDSLKELDELHDVVQVIRDTWGSDNIMILGDFNADGRYLLQKKLDSIRIRSQAYHWLIEDGRRHHEQIVVFGEKMLQAVVPNSATTFNFQKEFKLDDDTALSISDHYPVEVTLKTGAKNLLPVKRKTPNTPDSQSGRKKRSAPTKKKRPNQSRGESSSSPVKRRCVRKR